MSSRSDAERARSRAEARRRARLAARGEGAWDEEPSAEEEPQPETRTGLLDRFFPTAPPLPNRPDPLERFDPRGPLRPIRERIYLLARNPAAWLLTSLVCGIGYFANVTRSGDMLGLLGTFLTFGSIIAAGWFGWQRPTLFGVATAMIAFVLVWAVLIGTIGARGADPTLGDPVEVGLALGLQAAMQVAFGFIGGWYGGYLRRRQAQLGADSRRRTRRR